MKLVMLPGMDGTGELFTPLRSCLSNCDHTVIPLPQAGNQDYESLTEYVAARLPDSPFILLAESFSGGIAARLIQRQQHPIAGVIFAASFIEPPQKPWLLKTAEKLPIQKLLGLPWPDYIYCYFLLGSCTNKQNIQRIIKVIREVPEDILKARLETIQSIYQSSQQFSIPALYVQGRQDRLVTKESAEQIRQRYPLFSLHQINAGHLLLQMQPGQCAEKIQQFIQIVCSSG